MEDKSKPDQITKLVAGDVIHIDEASYINWSSPNGGTSKLYKDIVCEVLIRCCAIAFGVACDPTNAHPEDIVRREK